LLLFAGLVRAVEPRSHDVLTNNQMAEGQPTQATSKALKDELPFERAAQTHLR
jgi:hypothetical protein